MARLKDAAKRAVILDAAKSLFSKQGYVSTSISDIVRETGFPVGTIYTYFKNKEDILRKIVDEGWNNFFSRLEASAAGANASLGLLQEIINVYLPEMLADVDLISILFFEASTFTGLQEKMEKLSAFLFRVLDSLEKGKDGFATLPDSVRQAGLVIYFLGIINAFRLARKTSISLEPEDIFRFLKWSISQFVSE